jgi:hypothetical protein
MNYKSAVILLTAAAFLWAGASLTPAMGTGDPPRMTKEELNKSLGDPDVVVVDVRAGGSWTDSTTKIKGAVREDPKGVQNWIKKYPKDKTLVFYCS